VQASIVCLPQAVITKVCVSLSLSSTACSCAASMPVAVFSSTSRGQPQQPDGQALTAVGA
jgi:hypothetical protein